MRREEKLKERQAVGKWQIQIEGRRLAPLNCLKGQPKGESTDKLAWKFKLDHCFMSKTLKKKGASICARKTRHTRSHTPPWMVLATTESTMLVAELETFARKGRWCQHTKLCPGFFQMKICGCRWSRQCISTNGLVAKKKTDKIESSDKISSQESLKTCTDKEKFQTPSKNLAEQPIEVHSFVFCWCHQNRMTTRGQWTPKSKCSLVVTCHYSKTKFVSLFMQHTVKLHRKFVKLQYGKQSVEVWFGFETEKLIFFSSGAQQRREKTHTEKDRDKWRHKSFWRQKHELPADVDVDIAIMHWAPPVPRRAWHIWDSLLTQAAASSWNATELGGHAINPQQQQMILRRAAKEILRWRTASLRPSSSNESFGKTPATKMMAHTALTLCSRILDS